MSGEQPAAVGPWAREKLDALQRYLDYYTKVLKNQRWRTIYVDAYAGGGRAVVRSAATAGEQPPEAALPLLDEGQIDADQSEFIHGSPLVALEIPNPFSRYVFIDPDRARVRELETLQADYANTRQIDVLPMGAADGIRWVVSRNVSRTTHRGVVFLDPFGAGMDWATVKALADTRLFEVVVNFALNMAIQRMLPNSAQFQTGWRERLDTYFGTPNWYDEVYETRNDLLGPVTRKRDDYLNRLLALYLARLEAAFGLVSLPKLIRNTRGVPLYYLIWAGQHRKGLQGANWILSMGERLTVAARRKR